MASLALEIGPSGSLAKPWILPARGLAVFHGCPQVYKLSHYFLPRALGEGKQVLYLDGANRFDPLLLVRLARQRGADARELNRRIRVARAFTCFQLTELLCRAPRLLEKFRADIVMVTAVPELYFDEDVREPEARTSFDRALEALQRLAQSPVALAVFCDPASFPTARWNFFTRLKKQAQHVLKIEVTPDDKLAFASEKAVPLLLR